MATFFSLRGAEGVESLALHTDKYQLNMMYAHWKNGTHLKKCVFDLYFRELPFETDSLSSPVWNKRFCIIQLAVHRR